MLVPSCNLDPFLSLGSIEDRQAAFCEKIRTGVLRCQLRGYHGVGSGCRADYEALTGGKDTRDSRGRIGESNVLSCLRQLGDPAVLRRRLRVLLETCRKNNAALGVTGMLLYKDGNFRQVLEGDEGAMRGLYERIAADPRHNGEISLQEGFAEERQFPTGPWVSATWTRPTRDPSRATASSSTRPSPAVSSPATPPEPRSI
jgi:hypothetical protein